MKRIALIIPLAAILVTGIVIATKQGDVPQPQNAPQAKAYAAIQEKIAQGSPIIDVRTPEEFAEKHIKEAINLPLADIQAGKLPKADTSQTIYLYCRSGSRANQAKAILEQAGYKDIINLGGLEAVIAMGAETL